MSRYEKLLDEFRDKLKKLQHDLEWTDSPSVTPDVWQK